jgi:hypothetical protein
MEVVANIVLGSSVSPSETFTVAASTVELLTVFRKGRRKRKMKDK